MRTILFDDRGTLRSGWRAALFLMAFAFASALSLLFGIRTLEWLNIDLANFSTLSLVFNAVISLVSALLIGWLCAKYFEGLPFRSIGVSFERKWLRNFVVGILLGGITLGIAVLAALISGGLQFVFNSLTAPGDVAWSLATSLLVFGAAAAFEETLFRGYVLQTFARSGLAWLAIIVTSVFFGIVHMNNPSAGVVSTINTMLAGVWFSVAFLKTRDLWFVWGLHLMWNWTQGAIFGIEVSGITSVTTSPLFREIDNGPTWLTGQDYGIEGGLACTIALAISILLIYKLPGLEPDPELFKMTSLKDEGVRDLP